MNHGEVWCGQEGGGMCVLGEREGAGETGWDQRAQMPAEELELESCNQGSSF